MPLSREGDAKEGQEPTTAEASMFYVAYFKHGADAASSITFLFNGGPGSSTVWLHMGAWPRARRRWTTHTPAAPYGV